MYNKTNCFILLIILSTFYQSIVYSKNNKAIIPKSKDLYTDTLYNEPGLTQKKIVNWHQMFTDVPDDYYRLFKNTLCIEKLPDLFVVSFLTSSLLLIDQSGWKYQRSLYKKFKIDRNLSDIGIGMGNGEYQFLTSALFASAGVIFHDDRALKTGSNIAEAVLSTGLLVQV